MVDSNSMRRSTRSLSALLLFAVASFSFAHAQTDDAHRIFDLTNQDRVAQGLPPLWWNPALARAAQAHAEWMVREAQLSHQYSGEPELMVRAAHAGAHFQAIAENIALGPSPQGIESQWMHSTPHRTNILDPRMNALGVAVLEHNGSLYAVEDFAEASEALTASQVEQRVRDLLHAQGVDPAGPHAEAAEACRQSGMPSGSHARSVVRFETPDLRQLPPQIVAVIRKGGFRTAAVGACPPQEQQGSFTVYRVAILFY